MTVLRVFLAALAVLVAGAATAQESYRINPGDVLSVEVLQDPSLNRELLVLPDGSVSFPFAGTLRAGGQTVDQVQAAIAGGIASNFATPPNVFVTVRQIEAATSRGTGGGTPRAPRTISVFFLGEINSQGAAALEPGTTFLQALSQAGGLTNFAATNRVQLRRTDPATGQMAVYEIDYRAMMRGSSAQSSITLADGDVILVPERRLFE
jgi:polysaccharide export outer membrane protein